MNGSTTFVAFRIVISGRVQGVFFRTTMKSLADSNDVVGWVRNLPDGTVEALVQGKEVNVHRLIQWCNEGPKKANVTNVVVQKIDADNSYRNFAILY
ncbi:MAG: acylphosphatase [Nitrososphaerota archaeon]|nr:acylphosphatase [Nitrososphaerota archaeon]